MCPHYGRAEFRRRWEEGGRIVEVGDELEAREPSIAEDEKQHGLRRISASAVGLDDQDLTQASQRCRAAGAKRQSAPDAPIDDESDRGAAARAAIPDEHMLGLDSEGLRPREIGSQQVIKSRSLARTQDSRMVDVFGSCTTDVVVSFS